MACLFAFAIVGLLTNCKEEPEKVHVFELVSAIPPVPETKVVQAPPKTIPKVEPKPTIQPPPKPKSTPKPKVEPPSPTPPKPKPKVEPKPKPKPRPKPKPKVPKKPKTISFKDFQRTHKLPPAKPKPTPEVHKPAPRVRIDPSSFRIPEIKFSSPTQSRPNVDPNILNLYLSKVKARLEATWRQMQHVANLTSGGHAKVQFSISADGRIISPRIIAPSGNKTLDDLVLRACRSVGNLGKPPGGAIKSPLALPFYVN